MEEYLKKINFKLLKSEVLLDLPKTRKIEGVIIELKEEDVTIEILFNNDNKYLAFIVFEIETSDFWNDIEVIKVNNTIVDKIIDFNDLNKILYDAETNRIVIKLKNKELLFYEFGCIIHKEHFDGDSRHLNEILDNFAKDKIWPY